MEALKNAVAVLAGIIGLLTGVLTLYAKYLDVKKTAAHESDAFGLPPTEPIRPKPAPAPAPAPTATPRLGWVDPNEPLDWAEVDEKPVAKDVRPIRSTAADIARAREAVKAPAMTLLIAGLVSLFFNLSVAGYGYVDRFVTPLSEESRNRQASLEAAQRNQVPPPYPRNTGTNDGLSDDATVVLTICVTLCFSVASAAAAWAGYGMFRLESYWLSVVGSFAIMGGGIFCCMGGIPIGIWSLSVLYKPEVAAAFR